MVSPPKKSQIFSNIFEKTKTKNNINFFKNKKDLKKYK